jgi:hypothetical protein
MKAIFLLALALTCAVFSGCGGGSKEVISGTDVTRALLDGGGTTSGASVTTRTWRIVAIAGNQNYPKSGADQPCPVKLDSLVDDSQTLECGADDRVTITSDGTFKFQGFGKTWSLDGAKLTLDYGSALGVQVGEIVPETVGGKQRRGTLRPHDDGSLLVLEEVAM